MNHILISRTDNLGDVILTLPLAAAIKSGFPHCKVSFLGKKYTKPIIDACENIDFCLVLEDFILQSIDLQVKYFKSFNFDAIILVFPDKHIAKIAFKAGIPIRIATSHRFWNWFYCNKLINLSRKNSDLHEAQLNLRLLKKLNLRFEYEIAEIVPLFGLQKIKALPEHLDAYLSKTKKNVILHPRSKGSAREWGLENFKALINYLPSSEFNIFITGTKEEGNSMQEFLMEYKDKVVDLTGKLTMDELISFIAKCDSLVAASTGVLHLAAALGIKAIGIYAPMRPIFPKRWAPIGIKAHYLVKDVECNDCKRGGECYCIKSIAAEEVAKLLINE